MKYFSTFLLLVVGVTLKLSAQDPCLTELTELPQFGQNSFDENSDNGFYANYSVKATDWDEESTQSNIKIYRKGTQVHFFSEHARIFMDDKEVLIVMPEQKVVVLNTALHGQKESKIGPEFNVMRKEFFDSCEVTSCVTRDGFNKTLALRVPKESAVPGLQIESMLYEFNTENKKINKVIVNYGRGYKLKQLTITYMNIEMNSNYKFPAHKNKVVDRKGKLTNSYKGYELVDNRETNKKSN